MDDGPADDREADAGADDRRWTGRQQVAIEHDEVGVPSNGHPATPVLGEGGVRGAGGAGLQCVLDRQPLAREPAPRRLPVRGLAVDRVVERKERIERHHRKIRIVRP
jgi:hypothetical protein